MDCAVPLTEPILVTRCQPLVLKRTSLGTVPELKNGHPWRFLGDGPQVGIPTSKARICFNSRDQSNRDGDSPHRFAQLAFCWADIAYPAISSLHAGRQMHLGTVPF